MNSPLGYWAKLCPSYQRGFWVLPTIEVGNRMSWFPTRIRCPSGVEASPANTGKVVQESDRRDGCAERPAQLLGGELRASDAEWVDPAHQSELRPGGGHDLLDPVGHPEGEACRDGRGVHVNVGVERAQPGVP